MKTIGPSAACAVWCLGLAVLAGCSNGSLWGQRQSAAGATTGAVPLSPPANNRTTSGPAAWSDSLKKKLSATFDVKPKVVPASDPSRLDSVPRHLSPTVYVQGAGLAESQGNLASAQQQFEKALELKPNDIDTLVAYARFLDRTNRSEQAVALYQRARQAAPQNALVCNDLGLCFARRGEYRPALNAVEQAVALEPNNQRYRNNLATVLVEIGRAEDAVTALKPVYPPAVAYHNVGYILHSRQRPEAARYFEEALRRDPSFAPAKTMLAQVRVPVSPSPGLAETPRSAVPAEPVSLTQPSIDGPPVKPANERVWTPTRSASNDAGAAGPEERIALQKLPPVH